MLIGVSVPQLPVGGIGASGCKFTSVLLLENSFFSLQDGYQGGKFAFDTFIHDRPSIDVPAESVFLLALASFGIILLPVVFLNAYNFYL
jgi:hypothetical protein